jgi:predicted ATPase
VPASLHASLMARLDRLGPGKEVVQVGAAMGREFSHALLAAAAGKPDAELDAALERIIQAGLVSRQGTPPQATYLFKHALVQEAAYGTLLRGKRQELHARIARMLEERFPEAAEADPERVAQHYTAAGLAEPAARCWAKAGHRSIARSATAEALAQLEKGLQLLSTLPDTDERRRQELDLQIALGVVLMAARGWAAPEAGRANGRARELCEEIGATAQLWPVLYGQWVFHGVRGEQDAARELAEELLRRAEAHQDAVARIVGNRVAGTGAFWRGDPITGRRHLEQALALYDPERHRSLAFRYVQDPRVAALSGLSWALFVLGFPAQASTRSREARQAARELGHVHTLAYALLFACFYTQCARAGAEAREQAEALAALASEQRFSHFLGAATAFLGCALVERGEVETGLEQLRHGLDAWRASGAGLYEPYLLGLQADALRRGSRARESLEVLDEALARAGESNEGWFKAELHRLRGEALAFLGQPRDAEECFSQAIATAREQSAKSWELRASVSLARLWRGEGRRAEGLAALAPVYDWFTEGLDTPDLEEAGMVLKELRSS